jgi:hypothetical protein
VAEKKKGDTIKLVCFDADDKLIEYLTSGLITALLLQDPYRMGYDGVKTRLRRRKARKCLPTSTPAQTSSPRPTWTIRRSTSSSTRRSDRSRARREVDAPTRHFFFMLV